VKRSLYVVVLALLAFMLLGPIPKSLAGTPGPRLRTPSGGAPADVLGVGSNDAAAYGTGTILHADALRQGSHALVDLDVAFSGSAFSTAVPSHPYVNEVNRVVAAKLDANTAHGRGTGLELGLGSDPVPLIGQLAETTAPPSTRLIERVIGPLGVPGVLSVDLLRAQSQSRVAADGCVLGKDQSYGLGSVLNLNVLQGLLSTTAAPPLREVSQSATTTRIVPGSEPGRLALRSETRQTIAPVTFFKGTPGQFTIEVLGEWALRATADGVKSSVSYGPLAASPETPVLRVLGNHGQVLGQLTTQQLLGPKGLQILIPGVAEIAVGEAPRAIGGEYGSTPVTQATQAAAAVDVVRVRLVGGTLADVRVGHMEAAVNVPAAGVQCPGVKVVHTVDKPAVSPGQDFIYTVTVTNPNDCDLTHLKLVETPSGNPVSVQFSFLSTTPTGADLTAEATWPDLGGLDAGATKTFLINIKVPPGSAPGKLSALAVATGVCPAKPQPTVDVRPQSPPPTAPSPEDIPVGGSAAVDGPRVGVCIVPDLKHLTPATAKTVLEAAGCTLGNVKDGGPGNPADLGKIIDQGPKADTAVPLGTPVDITLGGPLCTVPSVAGLTPDQAKTKLEDAGCKLGTVTTGPTGNPNDAGKITSQNPPAGNHVPRGTVIDVVVFPPSCTVPTVTGLTEADAKTKLEAAGCKLGTVTPGPDNPSEAGKIVDQAPTGGTQAPAGTPVNVTIAGPVCTVPNLSGMTESEARTQVEAAGCVLTTSQQPTSNPADVGKVVAQAPAPATLVAKGSPVNASIGVQVAGLTAARAGQTLGGAAAGAAGAAAAAAPTLARTGGVALAGLALWLLIGGLTGRVTGSQRLWRLARRLRG
jgi:uncharacterized repeat protein (TIGR01451 family)